MPSSEVPPVEGSQSQETCDRCGDGPCQQEDGPCPRYPDAEIWGDGTLTLSDAARVEMDRLRAENDRLREALREIKRVAAIEAPPVSDEVPAKVWKLAFVALGGSQAKGSETVTCPQCDGAGKYFDSPAPSMKVPCSRCHGAKVVQAKGSE